MEFTDAQIMAWLVIPLLIFSARILDVSISTVRIIYIMRGKKKLAPILGFFEVLIWLLAISQIFKHLDNWACYFAWAAGFATGNYIGLAIEQKLAIGMQVVRVITSTSADNLIAQLKENGYILTLIDGNGANGPVQIIFMLIKRKELSKVTEIIRHNNPKAFYTVEDVQFSNDSIYSNTTTQSKRFYHHLFKMGPKAK